MTVYQFPKNMDLDIQPYIIFEAYQWKMHGKKTLDLRNLNKSVDSIILPISTNGIVDSFTHRWDELSGVGGSFVRGVVLKNIANKIVDYLGDVGKYIQFERGEIVNDYPSLAYSGTAFRTFEFSFTLIPKNAEESNIIYEIEKSFKRNSLPEYSGWKILYPHFWTIFLKMPNDKDPIKIKNCVITFTSFSKFVDGIPSITKDGNPQKVEFALTFTELQKTDRTEYK